MSVNRPPYAETNTKTLCNCLKLHVFDVSDRRIDPFTGNGIYFFNYYKGQMAESQIRNSGGTRV